VEKDKTNWILVFVLWFAGITAAMQFAKFSVAFDLLKNQYSAGTFWTGLSLSIVGFVGLIFGITVSIYISKIGHKKVLLASLLLGATISFVQALNPAFSVLFISRIIEGISHLGIVVTAPIIMVLASSKKHQSLVMGLWSSFFGVAFSITAWIGKPVFELYSVYALFLIHALLMTILLIALILLLKKMNIRHTEEEQVPFFVAHKNVYSNWRTFSPGLLFLFHTFMFMALLTFLPGLSGNENTKNLLLVILPLISIAGTIVAGITSQYFISPSKLSTIAFISLIALISVISFSFNNITLFVSASMVLILFSGIIQGSVFSLIPNISLTTKDQTNAYGAVAQLGNLGSTLGPPTFSYFLVFGKSSLIIIIILFSILGAISGFFITKRIKDCGLPGCEHRV